MTDAKTVIGITVSVLIIIVLFALAPTIGSTIEEAYTVTDTSTDGWNRTSNLDMSSPTTTWILLLSLITLTVLALVLRILVTTFEDIGQK